MAAYEDKIQALMDEVYTEWQKEENRGKAKWDILGGFSDAHQIAVMFGNFNHQVGNGGISQWIYNGYFNDDSEKFTQYLEIGAEADERCRTILDKIYLLDQYAQETDCDREGYFPDDEGDNSFIGDMIDGDAFDTWYYANCNNENWWQVVSGIIDRAEGRVPALVGQDERDSENAAAAYHPVQVYIENIHDDRIGGFAIPLPATPDVLQPFFEGAEITGWQDMKIIDVSSDIEGLGDILSDTIKKTMSADTLNELNYLAARIQTIQENGGVELFASVIESNRYGDSVAEIINLTFDDNMNRFDLLPAFTDEQYGEFLIEQVGVDAHANAFNRLESSDEPEDKALAQYIEKLEKYVDREAYGRDAIKEENGVLTENGLLMGGDGIKQLYRGPQDIPANHRIFNTIGEAAIQPLRFDGEDIAVTLMKLHAVCGGEMAFTADSLKTLLTGQDEVYLLSVNRGEIIISPITDAYKRGTEEAAVFMQGASEAEKRPDIYIFAVRVNERNGNCVTGDFIELNAKALQTNLLRHGVAPDRIDAVFSNGVSKSYDLWAWAELPSYARDDIRDYELHYPDSGLAEAERRFAAFVAANETVCKTADINAFLLEAGAAHMANAEYPRPGFIHITKDAAADILARGEADIYRMIMAGAEKLAPIEAARIMRFTGHAEYAVKRDDLAGLDKWAKRSVENAVKQNERGERDNTKNKGEEL